LVGVGKPLAMDIVPPTTYGLATPTQLSGRSGREILQAIIDGDLPQPWIARTLSFRITESATGLWRSKAKPGSTC